jgi:hypothetical protein
LTDSQYVGQWFGVRRFKGLQVVMPKMAELLPPE